MTNLLLSKNPSNHEERFPLAAFLIASVFLSGARELTGLRLSICFSVAFGDASCGSDNRAVKLNCHLPEKRKIQMLIKRQ